MDQKQVQAVRARRVFTEEFKVDAVRLVTAAGYTIAAAAKSVGVGEQSLRKWPARLAPQPAPCGEGASVDELRAENDRLRRELRRAEMERDILKKAAADFAKESPFSANTVKYAWIREQRDLMPVTALYTVLEVSTSGYYAWVDRPESPRTRGFGRRFGRSMPSRTASMAVGRSRSRWGNSPNWSRRAATRWLGQCENWA